MKNENTMVHEHPGRPRYGMKFPKSAEWTFTQLMKVNGIELDKTATKTITTNNGQTKVVSMFGKGENCTMLTLRKNLKHDMFTKSGRVNAHSLVVAVIGATAEPDSESGLGRRAKLYRLRTVAAKDHSDTKTKVPRKARKVNTEVADTIAAAQEIIATATPVLITPAPEVAPVIPTAPAPVESAQAIVETIPASAPVIDNAVEVSAADNSGTPPSTATLPVVPVS